MALCIKSWIPGQAMDPVISLRTISEQGFQLIIGTKGDKLSVLKRGENQ